MFVDARFVLDELVWKTLLEMGSLVSRLRRATDHIHLANRLYQNVALLLLLGTFKNTASASFLTYVGMMLPAKSGLVSDRRDR